MNRQLSLQQQTQILKDVQQHHRFTPLELPTSKGPLLYTQQSVFPGGSPQHQHQTFQHQQASFSPAVVTPATVAQHTTFQYDASQFGLKNTAAVNAFQQHGVPRPRARLVEPQQPNDALPSVPVYLQNDRQKLYQQIKDYNEQRAAAARPSSAPDFRPTPTSSSQFFFRPTAATSLPRFVPTPTTADDGQRRLQEQLQKQFTTQLQHRQELIRKLKLALVNAEINDRQAATPTSTTTTTTTTTTARPRPTEIFLSDVDGKLQVFNSEDDVINLQAVRSAQAAAAATTPSTPVVITTTTTTTPTPTVSFEELSKGVLPPGAQFEVIRHKQDGELEEVGKLPVNLPQKKVTFVFLEEQPDGTLKVQGTRLSKF